MDERAVVTVFLRNRGQVLLLKRSEEVGSYSGRWGAVAGHSEGDPETAARQEIEEETGIDPRSVTLVRRGDPFEVDDPDLGIRWSITPFLFDSPTRDIETDWESVATEWVHPPAIRTRETVPDLWTSYDRVRPRVDTVETDATHGSAYISIRALEVLRDEGALLDDSDAGWAAILAIATELHESRMEMAAVRNRVNRVMHDTLSERSPAAVSAAAERAIASAVDADAAAAARAGEHLGGDHVVTLSRSGTVLEALTGANPERVTVAVSRPGAEGRGMAEAIAEAGIEVSVTSDANLPNAIRGADHVLVGADTVFRDGSVRNKVGTTAALLAADRFDVPAAVVCAAAKISPEATDGGNIEWTTGDADAAELYAGASRIEVSNPIFERTPAGSTPDIITDEGVLDREAVGEVADQFAAFASWLTESSGVERE